MVRASINFALGRIFRQSDPLGQIFGQSAELCHSSALHVP